MASLNVVLMNKDRAGKYTLQIRLTHARKHRYIKTDFKLDQKQFANGRVKNHPNGRIINDRVSVRLSVYERALDEVALKLPTMSPDNVKNYLLEYEAQENNTPLASKKEPPEFFKFADEVTKDLKNKHDEQLALTGKASMSTYKNYKYSIRKLEEFRSTRKLYFQDITHLFLTKYIEYLHRQGLQNGIWNIIKDIKAIYNRAILDEVIEEAKNPFKRLGLSSIRKEKELQVLSVEELKAFIKYEPRTETEELAKDLFLLSFYLIGINPMDLYYLGKPQGASIKLGRFVFERSKTKQVHSIKVEPEAQVFLDKFKTQDAYVFQDHYRNKEAMTSAIREKGLWAISENLGFSEKLSLNFARHTWATIAYNDLDISESVIDFALGHKTQRTLAGVHYIKKDRSKMDAANRAVIDFLLNDLC